MANYTYKSDFTMPPGADHRTVMSALTQSDALATWFSEYADVSNEVGQPFRFWGRFTYEQPDESSARQTLVDLTANSLSFSWFLMNRNTTVEWSISNGAEGDATKLQVQHVFESLPDIDRVENLIDDLWRVHIGGLCSYLKQEAEIFRLDFSDSSPIVKNTIVIDAPRKRVFAALIEPEQIKRWFPAPAPFVDPQVGGDYGFGFSFEVGGQTVTPQPMKILELIENERLTITWPDWRMDPSVPDQSVTWLLEEHGKATRLTLIHQGFTRPIDVSDYPFGWQKFLANIEQVAKGVAPGQDCT